MQYYYDINTFDIFTLGYIMQLWLYKHYKWKNYEVLWTARHSETLEELVVYKALYLSEEFGEDSLRVRPRKMFEEKIIIDGKKIPRFAYVWDQE